MCRFCVEHGEGERWYLQAQNYSSDLLSDLGRRRYMLDFISGFEATRTNALAWAERLDKLPTPLSRLGRNAISRHMQPIHFGQPVPIEECGRIFDLATSITVIPCICRMHSPGKTAEEVCVLVTTQPVESLLMEGFKDYESGPGLDDFNQMTKQDAMRLLAECEERGLMHSVWTFQTPFAAAICNCNLASGCMAMRLTVGHDIKLMWRGEWVAMLDRESCTGCGACADLCPFGALTMADGAILDQSACWGCGICRSACVNGALALEERSQVPSVARLW